MVEEVSAVSQQTAAEATDVSAATEETASSLSEASDNIQHLSGLADDLHDNVGDFEVGTETQSSPPEPTSPDKAGVTSDATGDVEMVAEADGGLPQTDDEEHNSGSDD